MPVLADSVVIGAFIGLFGVIFTQAGMAYGKRKTYFLELEKLEHEKDKNKNESYMSSLVAAVDVLKSDYDRLVREVSDLRVDVRNKDKETRLLLERYSMSLSFINHLLIFKVLKNLGDEDERQAVMTSIPAIIKDDLLQQWPDIGDV